MNKNDFNLFNTFYKKKKNAILKNKIKVSRLCNG